MRILIERSNLLKSLSHVQRVVERRNTIPILSNVLLKTEDGGMRLKATDLDIEITETVPAMSEQPGATTVPAHLLYDIVRKLPDGSEVMLQTDGNGGQMTVTSGRSNFRLQCLPEADFPDITAGTFTHAFKLKTGDLARLIERTQFAISTEETRYYLNGISSTRWNRAARCSFARSRRTGIASPAPKPTRRRAPKGCRASSCRARPCRKSRSCSAKAPRWWRWNCPIPRSASRSARSS